jgi:hypothetical protein
MNEEKDFWDKADILSKLLVPIAIAVATLCFNYALGERQAREKTLELATGILQLPKSAENTNLRDWATATVTKETGIASAKLPEKAVQELNQGTQLPSTSQLQLPVPGKLRVSIIRIEGASLDDSNAIRSALIDGGYTDVTLAERSRADFPDQAEVRFYFPADSQNTQSLSAYINKELHRTTRVNDRSQDRDVAAHRPGDLHVYIK